MRKVIQLMAAPTFGLFVLCDDGTIWQFKTLKDKWDKFKQVPEEGDE